VAFFNGIFLIVWQDFRNGKDDDVLAARVSITGKVLDPEPISIAAGARTQTLPDVAADDEGFLVVWTGYRDKDKYPHIFATRVETDGTVGQASVLATGANPRIAWNGTHHFVAYETVYSQTNRSLLVKWLRMDKTKALQKGSGYEIYREAGTKRYDIDSLPETDGGLVLVRSHDGHNPWGGACSELATWIDSGGKKGISKKLDYWGPYTKECPYGAAAVASDSIYSIALWQRYHHKGSGSMTMVNGDIYASRVDGHDALEPGGIAVATSPVSERNPDVAGNGVGTMLVVYEKLDNGRAQIVSRFLSIGESLSVGKETLIMPAEGPGGSRRANPSVAFAPATNSDSAVFMVVWQEGWHGVGL